MSDLEQKVLTFVEITGADPDLARVFIKNNDWELEPAVEEYMNNPGRYMVESHAADESDASVRQPLAPIVSRLADDEYEPSARSRRGKRKRVEQQEPSRTPEGIFDALRDLKSEELYFRHLKTVQSSRQVEHQQHLANLYRPPHALITPGNFEEVNQIARTQNKWLLVNVHQTTQFDCLRINRDVWSKPPIQQLVRDYFVLWYVYTNTITAKPYVSYYSTNDWPHVAVLDPYTGERLAMWEGAQYAASATPLDEALNAFVAAHIGELSQRTASDVKTKTPAASEAKNSAANQRSATTTSDASEQRAVKRRRLADDEEERMMNLAIMASLTSEAEGFVESAQGAEGARQLEQPHDTKSTYATTSTYNTASNNNTNNTPSNTNTNNTNNNTNTTNNNTNNNTNKASAQDEEHERVAALIERQRTHAPHTATSAPSRSSSAASDAPTATAATSAPLTSSAPRDGPALQLQLRLPSSRTEPLSYSADTPLHVLLADTRALLQLSPQAVVSVSSNYPRRTFTAAQGEQSLRVLGIENKSVLFVDVSEE